MPVSLLKESAAPAAQESVAEAVLPVESVQPDSTPVVRTAKEAKPAKTSKFHREWSGPRREAVENYLRQAQQTLFLRDWTITVDWSRSCKKDGALATCTPMGDSRHATVRLSREFLMQSPRMQTQILLHELTHCRLFPLQEMATQTAEAAMSKQAFQVFEAALNAEIEEAVDGLADSYVDLMPQLVLPDL